MSRFADALATHAQIWGGWVVGAGLDGPAAAFAAAGVPTELHVVPSTCHGFGSLLPRWEMSRQLYAVQAAALTRAGQ
jgi:hypothetical protein